MNNRLDPVIRGARRPRASFPRLESSSEALREPEGAQPDAADSKPRNRAFPRKHCKKHYCAADGHTRCIQSNQSRRNCSPEFDSMPAARTENRRLPTNQARFRALRGNPNIFVQVACRPANRWFPAASLPCTSRRHGLVVVTLSTFAGLTGHSAALVKVPMCKRINSASGCQLAARCRHLHSHFASFFQLLERCMMKCMHKNARLGSIEHTRNVCSVRSF